MRKGQLRSDELKQVKAEGKSNAEAAAKKHPKGASVGQPTAPASVGSAVPKAVSA